MDNKRKHANQGRQAVRAIENQHARRVMRLPVGRNLPHDGELASCGARRPPCAVGSAIGVLDVALGVPLLNCIQRQKGPLAQSGRSAPTGLISIHHSSFIIQHS